MKNITITSILIIPLAFYGVANAKEFARIESSAGSDPYLYQTIVATDQYPSQVGGAIFFDHNPTSSTSSIPMGGIGATNLNNYLPPFPVDTKNGVLNLYVKVNDSLIKQAWVDGAGLTAERAKILQRLDAATVSAKKIVSSREGEYEPKIGGEIHIRANGAPDLYPSFGQRSAMVVMNNTADTPVGSALYIVSETKTATSSPIDKNAITLQCEHLPDNGFDSSCISVAESAGGVAGAFYRLPRATGHLEYVNTVSPTLEVGTDGGSMAGFFVAGVKGFLDTYSPYAGTALQARVDNGSSTAILATPGDGIFDDRIAYAVGGLVPNQRPYGITYQVLMNGLIKTQNDVYISTSTRGIVFTRPDGQCVRQTVDNFNQPIFTTISCP